MRLVARQYKARKKLWGLASVAKHLGISVHQAKQLAQDPDSPISKPEGSGMFFAYAEDLDDWLRGR